MRPLALILPLATFVLIAGCKPQETVNPVRYRSFNAKRTGSITADGRMRNAFIVASTDSNGNAKTKICAEPPPDIAADYDLESAVEASASLAITYSIFSGEGSGSGSSAWKGTSDVAAVAEKTEALLVVRESLYRLCELSLNTDIDKATAVSIFRELLYTTRDLGRHDVLEQIVEAIEHAVEYEGTTEAMLAELTRLAAHIATIETYQTALLAANHIEDKTAQQVLVRALSKAMSDQLRIFPIASTAALTMPMPCAVGQPCRVSSATAADISNALQSLTSHTYDKKGWTLGPLPLVLEHAGLEKDDVLTVIRTSTAVHDLSKITTQAAFAALIASITASKPTSLEIDLERSGVTETLELSFGP